MGCIDQVDFCVIRGDEFVLDVGLTASYVEVIEYPDQWVMNLVFREEQDDILPVYLALSASGVVPVDPAPDEDPILFTFKADTSQTQNLPDWDIVSYCELRYTGPVIGFPPVTRLFNSDVEVLD